MKNICNQCEVENFKGFPSHVTVTGSLYYTLWRWSPDFTACGGVLDVVLEDQHAPCELNTSAVSSLHITVRDLNVSHRLVASEVFNYSDGLLYEFINIVLKSARRESLRYVFSNLIRFHSSWMKALWKRDHRLNLNVIKDLRVREKKAIAKQLLS